MFFILKLVLIIEVLLFRGQDLFFEKARGSVDFRLILADETAFLIGSRLIPAALNQDSSFFHLPIFSSDASFVIGLAGPLKDSFVQGGSDRSSIKKNFVSVITKDYFIMPTQGWNWGKLHDYNAVDIAADCGQPILAAAEGLVIEAKDDNYWNEGYGNYILILHPTDLKTRYAHTAKNLVKIGDYVYQGQKIALIGNSGNTQGWTGCHLHFEVHGARNPFAAY